jgi:type VI secretion system secreted protein VgrG
MKSDGSITLSGKKIRVTGGDEVKMGVGNQNVSCDKQKVATSGAAINSSAVGMHEITGALVKLN